MKTNSIILLCLLLLATSRPPTSVQAATITVTTTDDELNTDGDCSLREAIVAANSDTPVDACPAGDGPDHIDLPAGDYVFSLQGINENEAELGDLDITEDLTIIGAGRANTIIDANDVDRAFHLHPSAQDVEISRLTVRGGYAIVPGAIYVYDSNLSLLNARVRENAGTAAVYVTLGGELTVVNSRIYDNTAHGLRVGVNSSATVLNSLISGNSAHYGAGISNSANLTLVNSTVSGNSSTLDGGGLRNSDPVASTTLINTTVTNNTADSDGDNFGNGGGLHVDQGTTTIRDSIVAGNEDGSFTTDYPDCSGNLFSDGYNLIQSTAGCTISGITTGNLTGVDPLLDTLQDNGGPTLTHALLDGSPAIDAGSPAVCEDANGASLTTDQRGYVRPVDGDGSGSARCDIGAFEYASGGPRPSVLVVDRTSSVGDINPGDGRCDIATGGADDCGLRAAIEEVNALGLGPGAIPIRITFDIPGSGPHTFNPLTPFPAIEAPVVIEGHSQPGASCPTANSPATLQIVLNGSFAGAGDGLVLAPGSDGSTIGGLAIGNFPGSGLEIASDDNAVVCNHLGLGADGLSPMGNGEHGVWLIGNRNDVGLPDAATFRNVVSANHNGVYITGDDNSVMGNFVGATADGLAALPNFDGIAIIGGDRNHLGIPPLLPRIQPDNALTADITPAGNVIAGNTRFGIHLTSVRDTTIMGNLVGVARDGLTPLPNGSGGIRLLKDSYDSVIGGLQPGRGNVIAHNGAAGGVILLEDGGAIPLRNQIQGNAIYDNDGLGIDLGPTGVNPNDDGDAAGGENRGQNYPVLQAISGSQVVSIALNSTSNEEFQIDLYRSDDCDPSGFGEGRQHLHSGKVTTNGEGQVTTNANLAAAAVSPGDYITATATDFLGNTSEFSACVRLDFDPQITPTPTATVGPSPTPTVTGTPPPGSPEIYLPFFAN